MSNVLHRITKQYLTSVNTPDYNPAEWIINPDLGAVAGVHAKYWLISGDTVTEMSQPEKDAVDAAEQSARIVAIRAALKQRFEQEDDNTKALGILAIQNDNRLTRRINDLENALSEIKALLKPAALNSPLTYNLGTPLSEVTNQQAKTQFENIVDSL